MNLTNSFDIIHLCTAFAAGWCFGFAMCNLIRYINTNKKLYLNIFFIDLICGSINMAFLWISGWCSGIGFSILLKYLHSGNLTTLIVAIFCIILGCINYVIPRN